MESESLARRVEQLTEQRQRFLPTHECREDALIEMKDILKVFENAAGKFTALNKVTTCFYAGEFVSIVGKSGSGKSTLVNMLTGIDHPTSGSVRVGDTYIHQMSENNMSLWRGANLGIVFQFFQLVPTLTLLENVILPMVLAQRIPVEQRESRAQSLLELVGLGAVAEKLPAAVSGGQQQSAAIARALANDPPILIADEPTGNLDTRSADEVFELFGRLIESGKTILMVTHDAQLARRTSRTLLLSDGELINPWIAAAFPELGHAQLLWLTHQAKPVRLEAGALLSSLAGAQPGLLVVSDGELSISTQGSANHRLSLEPGAYLCPEDLDSIAVQGLIARSAQPAGCGLLSLEAGAFQEWLKRDPAASAGMQRCGSDFNLRWEAQA